VLKLPLYILIYLLLINHGFLYLRNFIRGSKFNTKLKFDCNKTRIVSDVSSRRERQSYKAPMFGDCFHSNLSCILMVRILCNLYYHYQDAFLLLVYFMSLRLFFLHFPLTNNTSLYPTSYRFTLLQVLFGNFLHSRQEMFSNDSKPDKL
jgi:hypothetical protein